MEHLNSSEEERAFFDTWGERDARADQAYANLAISNPEIVTLFTDTLTNRGIGQFMHSSLRLLNGMTPLETMLEEGGYEKVIQAIHSFEDGSYI
jgi:hypothetical protein